MKVIVVKSKFWATAPKRVVFHQLSDNTIHVNGQVFKWDYFFQVNELV
jgi:hypothetical protein